MSSTPESVEAAAIVSQARGESALWVQALRRPDDWEPVFSPLAPSRFGLGLETVYEAYLVHYGRPRLFAPPDGDEAVLLGDYLYAHGLVHIAEAGGVDAVAAMAELISRCAALRADGGSGQCGGDGEAWIDTARRLGGDPTADQVDAALARHCARVAPGVRAQ
jgi:hypothetical protein